MARHATQIIFKDSQMEHFEDFHAWQYWVSVICRAIYKAIFLVPFCNWQKQTNKNYSPPPLPPKKRSRKARGRKIVTLFRVMEEIMKNARFRASAPGNIFLVFHFCVPWYWVSVVVIKLIAWLYVQLLQYVTDTLLQIWLFVSLNAPFPDFTMSACATAGKSGYMSV